MKKIPSQVFSWNLRNFPEQLTYITPPDDCLRIRPWDYPENCGIYSQLDRKSKTWFFTFLNVYVFWIEQGKILISQLSPPKFIYFADQNGPKREPYEKEFWQFSNTKMNIANRAQKLDEKYVVSCLVSFFPSWVMVFKVPKIVSFL